MAFILSSDGRDENVLRQFQKYNLYLDSNKNLFPASAYSLANSDWYFDSRDHRCPHDAWLVSAKIVERKMKNITSKKSVSFFIKLLGHTTMDT